MGLGIARANIDYAITHTNGSVTHVAPAQTIYVASQAEVFINGQPGIVLSDLTACGDTVIGTSSSVFIGGKPVHRLTDSLTAHEGTFSPSVCAQASTDVFAG